MILECLIIDDDEIARRMVRHCVERTDFLHLAGSCASVPEALKIIREKKIDLIFLDVEMPEMSGIDFLRTFKEIPQIILITGKKEYAAEAFDYDVTDFLLKPIDYGRFLKAVMKAQNIHGNIQVKKEEDGEDALFIKKEGGRLVRLAAKDIIWVEALADYVNLHTREARHTLLATMKSIEARLPSKDFIRIHRSYIVRLDQVKEIEENSVIVHGKVLPVSRSHKEDLYRRLKLL
ncbi:MAG TPA: LytTR family DNA-binding domain-containing protein [Bacteroidia bacterium]|nr:LytTR family DNA-binding domain-containing protein [Bacteroidia bacterium]